MTDLPERFKWLKAVYVGERQPRLVAIESVRFHQEAVLLKLAGYPTRDEAELLRGELLQVLEADAIPLEEGEYFLFQLLGLDVHTEGGEAVGRISDVLETGANNVFVIDGPKQQFLVPDIPEVVVSIDIENNRMDIRPLPGLLNDPAE
jgi:16S rRNA processing protein RimM